MRNHELWYSEIHARGVKFSMEAELLHQEQTPFQKLLILRNDTFGVFLTLDGFVQLTERDEFIYHDMICHPALAVNPDIRRVLIIGGGDGGTAREVARYPRVERIDMVEIDEAICRLAREYLPQTAVVFSGEPRLKLIIGDGVSYVKYAPTASYDLILVDSTDPFGPGKGLFTKEFYANCNRVLTENGILINQHEGAFYAADARALKLAHEKIAASFPIARIFGFNMPTYASGYWYFGFASKKLDPLDDAQHERWQNLNLQTRYYNADMHRAAFALPTYVKELLRGGE
ncbi:MAG: polyamine aminopropyltransferase [Clostridiales bacterium]|nr:polyamine aminopropyltransferase [Clostridiales bacterium]